MRAEAAARAERERGEREAQAERERTTHELLLGELLDDLGDATRTHLHIRTRYTQLSRLSLSFSSLAKLAWRKVVLDAPEHVHEPLRRSNLIG